MSVERDERQAAAAQPAHPQDERASGRSVVLASTTREAAPPTAKKTAK